MFLEAKSGFDWKLVQRHVKEIHNVLFGGIEITYDSILENFRSTII
jgi:hypothetical protein